MLSHRLGLPLFNRIVDCNAGSEVDNLDRRAYCCFVPELLVDVQDFDDIPAGFLKDLQI
jgi:hypothetical protein